MLLFFASDIQYHKIPKYSDTRKIAVHVIIIVMSSKDADRMTNSVDPDQTAD